MTETSVEKYIDYFKEYYSKKYNAYDFVIEDGKFGCTFGDNLITKKLFRFNILSAASYECMEKHNVLNRYLEAMKLRYSQSAYSLGLRSHSHDYACYMVSESMLDRMDEWLAYITNENLNEDINLPEYGLTIVNPVKKHRNIYIYDTHEYNTLKSFVYHEVKYYGEIENIDGFLSE